MIKNKETIKAEIIEGLKADLKEENDGIKLHDAILKALKQYDGKPISRRIATAIQKEHPTWVVYFNDKFGMYYIDIWGKDTGSFYDCGSKFSALIGYDKSAVKADLFDKKPDGSCGFDGCHGYAAHERNSQREKLLKDDVSLNRLSELAYSWAYAEQCLDAIDYTHKEYQARYIVAKIINRR